MMTTDRGIQSLQDRQVRVRPSEHEVLQLLQECAQQYEQYLRLADLADLTDEGEFSYPKHDWDDPIGIVVTKSSITGIA